jgi:hypothetical protein
MKGGEREISKIHSKFLLVGRYEGHDPEKLGEDGAVFIKAIKYIHAIGHIWSLVRK